MPLFLVRLVRLVRAVKTRPLDVALWLVAIVVTVYAAGAPLAAAVYPPMTDLPFHAAQTSILRHYGDPDWHFREQFTVSPIAVPYVLHYAVGAALMWVLPPMASVKVATFLLLALVPAGLAVWLSGLGRDPLLALVSVPFVYCTLSHWGFVSFMGALGLFAMAAGLALHLVRAPSVGKQLALALVLVLAFFAHIFRFPFTIAAVIGSALVVYPATRRIRPVLLPLVPSLALFAAWLVVRPTALATRIEFALDLSRMDEIPSLLFAGYQGDEERHLAQEVLLVGAIGAAIGLASRVIARRASDGNGVPATREPRVPRGFHRWAWIGPAACALVFLAMFLTLPMQMGVWWYVYPREATAFCFVALASLPSLPRAAIWRGISVIALAWAALGYGRFVEERYAEIDRATEDFTRIVKLIPRAPKLMYLIFDHGGTSRRVTPFVHLPAYVQAEKGGFLSFHFAVWGASPIAYRSPEEPGAVVPPAVPTRWEWTPEIFDVMEHGAFFDWFLVRSRRKPDKLFAPDLNIRPIGHEGTWWLFHRVGPPRPGHKSGMLAPENQQ